MIRLAAVLVWLVLACGAATAQPRETPVDVELVLAADVSRSIDDEEFHLQRQGYAEAFRNPRVINAIRSGPFRRIAVTFVEWTGIGLQTTVIPWTVIEDAGGGAAFAAQLAEKPRAYYSGGGTAVGEAIFHAATLFADNGFEGTRQVIDVSGDGPTNRGRPAAMGRDFAVAQGITVNGLPILGLARGLDRYYEQNVVGGPGGFMVPADGFNDFAQAVLSKLIREIAAAPAGETLHAARAD